MPEVEIITLKISNGIPLLMSYERIAICNNIASKYCDDEESHSRFKPLC